VYVHCTAGLGRAPAAIIAYLFWFQNYSLEEAYSKLTAVRPCGPKKAAIRAATFDLLDDRPWEQFEGLPEHAFTELNDDDRRKIQHNVCGGEPPAQPAM
jgi:protein-tyrosine phosphatase